VTAAAASPATVIVLRGDAGTFCSGADLRSIRTDDASYLRTRLTESMASPSAPASPWPPPAIWWWLPRTPPSAPPSDGWD
jgi:hypothetical protein